MLGWQTWIQLHTEERATLSDNLDMQGSYCYFISTDNSLSSTWQTSIIANTDYPTASNFKIRAYVRKNTTNGCLYLFARANEQTKQAYILELKDAISLYKGTLGEPFSGNYIESTGTFCFPKNVTYHLEFTIHTTPDNKTFIQVKKGDKDPVSETWDTVFSVILENETALTGYWGFGIGSFTRREFFYLDNIQYFIEY